jgi:hypothetical protein
MCCSKLQGIACNYSVQKLLSYCLLFKNVNIKICKIIILPLVLYECEIWSLALREEHSLRVFESRVLRRIFGLKRDEIIGDWRKLHYEDLHNLYCWPDIPVIRMIKSNRTRYAGPAAHRDVRGVQQHSLWFYSSKL